MDSQTWQFFLAGMIKVSTWGKTLSEWDDVLKELHEDLLKVLSFSLLIKVSTMAGIGRLTATNNSQFANDRCRCGFCDARNWP